MSKLTLSIPIAPAIEFAQPLTVAATLALPETVPSDALDLLVCLHGASYSRWYWDAWIDGHPGYSFIDYFLSQGKAVLTLDALGMGDSSKPLDEGLLNPLLGAQAHHQALANILCRIDAGDFGAELAAKRKRISGIGHSMGGMLTIIQQASFRSFDQVAILGFTNISLDLPDEVRADLEKRVEGSGYSQADRGSMRASFHAPDVPEAVIAADNSRASVTPNSYGRLAIVPGGVADQAAAIDVPVYLHFADIDVSPDPLLEPSFYGKSRRISLMPLAGSAHCHNFASTRSDSWTKLNGWIDEMAKPGE